MTLHTNFDIEGEEEWYIAPAIIHYQCFKILSKRTHAIRTPTKVKFYPSYCKLLYDSSAQQIIDTIKQLTNAITNPVPDSSFYM